MSEIQSTASPAADPKYPAYLENVDNMTRYMRFLGAYGVVCGVIYCLGIVTALVGVPVIFMGLRFREAADAFDRLRSTNAFEDLALAVEKQTQSVFIMYVLVIVGLVLLVLYIVALIYFAVVLGSGLGELF